MDARARRPAPRGAAGARSSSSPGGRGGADAALRADLASHGMRLTAPRRLILAVVRETDSHPTAEWVHAAVRRRLPRVSLATVYRNLRRLADQGLLGEIPEGPSVRFDARVDRHHHFTCTGCSRIFDLAERVDARLDARLAARTGFRVSHHRIEFYGLCAGCVAGRGPTSLGRAARGKVPRGSRPHPQFRRSRSRALTPETGGR